MPVSALVLSTMLRPFAVAAAHASNRGERFGGNPTGFGEGVRVISSNPFMDGWRQVNDPFWPTNWNAHLVFPDGTVAAAVPHVGFVG